jgi:hypothetical protein
MTELNILILTRSFKDDTTDKTDSEHFNFGGQTLEEVYKNASIFIYHHEEDFFCEMDIELPSQSIDFIKNDESHVYQEYFEKLISDLNYNGDYYYNIHLLKVNLVIEDNLIKDFNF